MFGLEIRKVGTIGSIYRDVDLILKESSIPARQITKDLMRDGVAHSLFKMFQPDNYLNICTIDSCIKLTNIVIPPERYRLYHSQHCVHWRDMTEEFSKKLIALILDDFREVLTYDELQTIEKVIE